MAKLKLCHMHGIARNIAFEATIGYVGLLKTVLHAFPVRFAHKVYNCGVLPVPSKLALIFLFAFTRAAFMNTQQAILSTEKAIIKSIALTYRGSSPALKKYGLLQSFNVSFLPTDAIKKQFHKRHTRYCPPGPIH